VARRTAASGAPLRDRSYLIAEGILSETLASLDLADLDEES
jgi:hypothetical protein